MKIWKKNILERTDKSTFIILLFILLLLVSAKAEASDTYWEVRNLDNPASGYLYVDLSSEGFALIDNYGMKQFVDTSSYLKTCINWKMLRDGTWGCFNLGSLWIYNEDLQFLREIKFPQNYGADIHDCDVTDDGHYLLLCTEQRVVDMSQIVEGGDTAAVLNYHVIVETDESGVIYFIWNSFEHFEITDATSDIDLTQKNINIQHANSIAIDIDGNYLLSSRHYGEVTKINKLTGDIIWRLGGSECKNNEFVFINDTVDSFFGFSHQHSVNVLDNGNILLFDNGNLKPNQFSRAVEYTLDVDNRRCTKVWEYRYNPDIFRNSMANVQRLDNGNTLINWVSERITEVRPDKSIAFEIILPEDYATYRAFKYVTKMNSKRLNISSNGSYSFTGGNKEQTSITIDIDNLVGQGNLTVEKHNYAPPSSRMSFLDSGFSSVFPYRWVVNNNGIGSITGEFRIKVGELSGLTEPSKASIYKRSRETVGDFAELNTGYNSLTGELTAEFSDFGEFIICSKKLGIVELLNPGNNETAKGLKGLLKWQKIIGATQYRIQLSNEDKFTNPILNVVVGNVDEIEYSVEGNDAVYFWRVQGMNNKDTSVWSNIYSFSTELESPKLMEPSDNAKGIRLHSEFKWNLVSGATNYRIQIAYDVQFKQVAQDLNISSNSSEVDLADFSTKYYWRVKAMRSEDSSSWSDVWSFTTKLTNPVLLLPNDGEMNADTSGKLQWSNVGQFVGYNVRISTDSLFGELTNEGTVIENYYDYYGLKYNENYYWQVRCVNETDTSDWSTAFKLSTKLAGPYLTNPKNKQIVTANKILLVWNDVQGASVYDIEISYDSQFSVQYREEKNFAGTSLLLNDLPKGKELFWKVKAKNDSKFSNWSAVWNFSVLYEDKALDAPNLINPENNSIEQDTSGFLVWYKIDEADSYLLELSDMANFSNVIISESISTDTTFLYYGLEHDKNYSWHVRGEKADTIGPWSETWNFTTKKAVGVEKDKEMVQYLYLKNGALFLNLNYTGFVSLSIYNLTGMRIPCTWNNSDILINNEILLDINHLTNGIYFLTIENHSNRTNISYMRKQFILIKND